MVNYRRYRDAAVEFPDGLIGIVGRNGAGKSSLLEAVLWALFGHDAARTSKELLKRQGAAPGDDVLVRLDFTAEGHRYTVTRRLRGKSMQPEAAVEADGNLLVAPGANSWDQANHAIAQLLGFDRSSFESTVVAKQGELAALSELRPAQRKRLLLDMLGIERIESAIQACRTEARLLDARLAEARRALDGEMAVRSRLEGAERELATARANLADATAKLQDHGERAKEERARADRLLDARIRDQELRVRLQGLQSRLEAVWTQRTRNAAEAQILREREAEAARAAEQLANYASLDEEIAACEQVRRAVEERTRIQRRVDGLAQELRRWTPLAEAAAVSGPSTKVLESRLTEIEEVLDKLTHELAWLDSERARTADELQRLRDSAHGGHAWQGLRPEDDCPVCERPLGDSVTALARRREEGLREQDERHRTLETRLAEVQASLARVRGQRERAHKDVEASRKSLQEARAREREADFAGREVARVTAALQEHRAQLQALPEAVDEARAILLTRRRTERDQLRDQQTRAVEAARRLPRLRDEDRVLQAEETKIVEEREKASRELHQLAYPTGAWEKARAVADQVQREADLLERQVVQWRERAASWEREAKNLAEQAHVLEAAKERLATDMAHLKVLETVAAARGDVGVLPEFKAHLVGRIRPALARASASLIRQMTAGKYAELLLDDDYGVHLYDGAIAHPMERFSGGERDITNLSLRLAVSELVANARGRSRLQFVALDEVFGSQDGERRDAVMRCLGGLSNVFRQVFVVTHLEDVRDRMDHVLRIDEAPDGTGTISGAA